MSSKNEKDRTKQIQDRCQTILNQLLKDEDNKYCVDCDAKGPRWASWNLGIFLCIRCAGIHRNLGVHISKVKSVNLDSWTPEQVVSLQQMGNSRARAVYEANLPDSFRRPQTDSAIEAFVRAKYEQKKYIAREWVPPSLPKVNWDKEIDEEIEKQKRKKKSSSGSSISTLPTPNAERKPSKSSDVLPQPLPKSKISVSPKPGRSATKITLNEPKGKDGADLLGLDNSIGEQKRPSLQDDIFGGFLSNSEVKNVNAASGDSGFNSITDKPADLNQEEQSFFNQPAPTEKEKSKMTKDSILALYNQAPSPPQFNSVPPNLVAYNQSYPQAQFVQAPYQQQSNFANHGISNFPNGSQLNQYSSQNQFTQQNNYKFTPNQFAPPPPQQQQQFPAFGQFPNGSSGQQNSNGVDALQANLYGPLSHPLSHQFGSLSVSQGSSANFATFPNAQAPPGSTQNIATSNSWQ